VEKLDTEKVWSALYWDGAAQATYIKRFTFEASLNTVQPFISPEAGSRFIDISEDEFPQLKLTFPIGGKKERDPEMVDVEQFIGVKSFRAKGRKVTYLETDSITFDEPLLKESSPETEIDIQEEMPENIVPEADAGPITEDAPSETAPDGKAGDDGNAPVDLSSVSFSDDDEPTLF